MRTSCSCVPAQRETDRDPWTLEMGDAAADDLTHSRGSAAEQGAAPSRPWRQPAVVGSAAVCGPSNPGRRGRRALGLPRRHERLPPARHATPFGLTHPRRRGWWSQLVAVSVGGFDLAGSPGLVEPGFEWAVEAEDREPALAGNGLEPVDVVARRARSGPKWMTSVAVGLGRRMPVGAAVDARLGVVGLEQRSGSGCRRCRSTRRSWRGSPAGRVSV